MKNTKSKPLKYDIAYWIEVAQDGLEGVKIEDSNSMYATKIALEHALNLIKEKEIQNVAKLHFKNQREKESRRRAALPKDMCPECEGEGEQGGQFCGGYWKCETCNGTGKKCGVK